MSILYSSYIKNPRQVFFEGEDEGEEVLLALRKHFVTNLRWFAIFLFMIFLPVLTVTFATDNMFGFIPAKFQVILVLFWYVFSFGYFFSSYLIWFYSVYIVSNMRVVDIDFHHLLHRSFSEAPLRNIEDLTHVYLGAVQPIFDYATLYIQTAGESKEIEFELIPRPGQVQDFISDLVKYGYKNRHKGSSSNINFSPDIGSGVKDEREVGSND